MPFDFQRARPLLHSCDLTALFVEELGWEPCRKSLVIRVGERDFALQALAEKRGFIAWLCETPEDSLPDHATRLKLDRKLSETSFEHLIVFVPTDRSRQSWVWLRREPGKPLAARVHEYRRGQPGDSLLQKLQALYVSLEEEEAGEVSTVSVAARARAAFDIERVTKSFYRDFDAQRKAFCTFIEGIGEVADRQWYTSVMLNRLMFVYFIQRKGFLDGDPDYLRNRLARCQQEKGKDTFYTFYRYFLLRLFHEGFGKKRSERAADLEKLLGNIPYLNGGLFDVHELEKPERYGATIQIPDEAFERVFDYFDRYQWHLDERPLKRDDEINPDVLGYIFEKYINQKQMGAYYTKEDITEYIGKNTVIPFLFDAARAKCKVAFDVHESGAGVPPAGVAAAGTAAPLSLTVWGLLTDNPDRYIYAAVRHGVDLPLPSEIAVGVDTAAPGLLERRKGWNKPAPAEYALPTEIWREVVARRQRCEELRQKLASGEVREINDLITLNLDIRQFAQDVIENCEGPDLLAAFWQAISGITILDPTGGSGAFIFAALNILDPLYEACLDRMEAFLAEWECGAGVFSGAGVPPAAAMAAGTAAPQQVRGTGVSPAGSKKRLHPNYYKAFSSVLSRVEAHPNRRYFVLKSIILNNLYAVDIMEEAVEICKLRLFLKLAAQVDPDPARDNLGIEPLPDIDFNIRAGNTLVGYATADEVRKAFTQFSNESAGLDGKISTQGRLLLGDEAEEFAAFNTRCADVQQAFDKFRQCQTDGDGTIPAEHKHKLQERLAALNDELNRHLADEYDVPKGSKTAFAKWLKTHQPFHWFVQFYGILNSGGFDVIIGNPPYIELNALDNYRLRGYVCQDCGNLYALVMERCEALGRKDVRQGYIVPVSSVSTERYESLQNLLVKRESIFSSFDDRPSRLFDGLEHIRLTVHLLGRPVSRPRLYSTRYNKWMSDERASLFHRLLFTETLPTLIQGTLPKLCSAIERAIIVKLASKSRRLAAFYSRQPTNSIYYSRKVGYFLQVLDFQPTVSDGKGNPRPPSEFKDLSFACSAHAAQALCCLNSTLFYWFTTVYSDCRHVNKREVDAFPVDLAAMSESPLRGQLDELGRRLMNDLKANSDTRVMRFKHDTLTVQCLYPKFSKAIIDEIDTLLARHYGFTEEELDFIINYDIKYRLGRDAESEEE